MCSEVAALADETIETLPSKSLHAARRRRGEQGVRLHEYLTPSTSAGQTWRHDGEGRETVQ